MFCEIVGPNSRGKLLGRWKDRVKEYMSEKGPTTGGEGLNTQGESIGIERNRGFPAVATPLGHGPEGSEIPKL